MKKYLDIANPLYTKYIIKEYQKKIKNKFYSKIIIFK